MTVQLDGIDLVIFDKDGTLIDFGTMWSGWAETLAERLSGATGRPVDGPLFAMLGYDPVARRVTPGGGLAATPMARLRERTRDVLVAEGVPAEAADDALAIAWHAPDPVGLTHPLADLDVLFGAAPGERAAGRGGHQGRPRPHGPDVRCAGVDGRDRRARLRRRRRRGQAGAGHGRSTCAPRSTCRRREPRSSGDSPADLRMARAAGAGLVVGVLTGVGGRDDLEPLADVVLDSVGAIAGAVAGRPVARSRRRPRAARSERPSCDRPSGGA